MRSLIAPANGFSGSSPPHGPASLPVPALFDTGALELLRRRHRRAEILALRYYPPVICPQVAGEFIYAQFQARVSEPALVAARIFLAPFEVLSPSPRTPDICAQLRAGLAAEGVVVAESVCWIAAHAFEHNLPVVTTDRDFRRVPGLHVRVLGIPPTVTEKEKRRPALAGRL